MISSKAPFTIQVIWHPLFEEGRKYADLLYDAFSRPIDDPLARGIGIQVQLRSDPAQILHEKVPDEVGTTFYVLLMDEYLIADDNEDWEAAFRSIAEKNRSGAGWSLIVPVLFSERSLENPEGLPRVLEQIRLNTSAPDSRTDHLIIRLVHLFYRYLEQPSSAGAGLGQKVKLFLSHAKKDGKEFIQQLNTYIRTHLRLDTFFDALDMETGFGFDQQIIDNVGRSALIVLQTDAYSSRPWCRKEIITAKIHQCPIVVLNELELGEKRSFPYMSNVPVIHLSTDFSDPAVPDAQFAHILRYALLELFRFKYQQHYLRYIDWLYGTKIDAAAIFPSPPELITVLPFRDLPSPVILYPDPLLGDEETNLLSSFNREILLITPQFMPLLQAIKAGDPRPLRGMKVALSISEVDNVPGTEVMVQHLQDVMTDIARHLLAAGAALVYGGSLHHMNGINFTTFLFDLVRSYNTENVQPAEKVLSYTVFPYSGALNVSKRADLKPVAKIIEVATPQEIKVDRASWETYIGSPDPAKKAVTAQLLTLMREKMNDTVTARILIGGKTEKFDGRYPGVLEEALLALRSGKPLYLSGGYGGCTRSLCELLQDDSSRNPISTRYPTEVAELRSFGWAGLNNGLSPEDNLLLAEATRLADITQWILKGLLRSRKH